MALTNEDLQAIAQLMEPMNQRFDKIESQIQEVKAQIQEVKAQNQEVQVQIQEVNRRVTNIELTLENETNKNIIRVAEGHLDLTRKLDDALKIENEKEMLAIRVNILENELRKVKEKLTTIA